MTNPKISTVFARDGMFHFCYSPRFIYGKLYHWPYLRCIKENYYHSTMYHWEILLTEIDHGSCKVHLTCFTKKMTELMDTLECTKRTLMTFWPSLEEA